MAHSAVYGLNWKLGMRVRYFFCPFFLSMCFVIPDRGSFAAGIWSESVFHGVELCFVIYVYITMKVFVNFFSTVDLLGLPVD